MIGPVTKVFLDVLILSKICYWTVISLSTSMFKVHP